MNKRLAMSLAAGALAVAAQQQADAISIRLTQGATVKTIADGSVVVGETDANPLADVVTYIGAVGTYTINVTTGQQNPGNLDLDLNSVDTSVSPGGTLKVELSAPISVLDATSWNSSVGGTTQGSFTWNVYAGGSLFDHGSGPVGTLGPFSPVGFSGGPLAGILPVGTTYVTLEAVITHGTGLRTSSFDGNFTLPDGGATAMLLGLGFLGLGAFRRKA